MKEVLRKESDYLYVRKFTRFMYCRLSQKMKGENDKTN